MTGPQASRVVLLSGGAMATFVLIDAARRGKPRDKTYRSLWAVGVLTIGMSVFADFAPRIAGPFALLVLIAAAARNTGAIGSVIGGPASAATTETRSAGTAPRKRTVRGGD